MKINDLKGKTFIFEVCFKELAKYYIEGIKNSLGEEFTEDELIEYLKHEISEYPNGILNNMKIAIIQQLLYV